MLSPEDFARGRFSAVAVLASEAELLILDAQRRGGTVLLPSLILAEIETLADRLSIIRDGRIVALGTLTQLRGT